MTRGGAFVRAGFRPLDPRITIDGTALSMRRKAAEPMRPT